MQRYELSINILNRDYVDNLVISLARQGYAPYISIDGDKICIEIDGDELIELKKDW